MSVRREAGATVRCHTKLHDMNVAISADDDRSSEVLASGLPLHHGSQLAVDITLRSATTAQGLPCPGAASTDGSVLVRARKEKEHKYHELVGGERCRLIVVARETGGRWSCEAMDDGCGKLAGPHSALFAWRRQWMRMLAVSCARACASSLASTHPVSPEGQDGFAPGRSLRFVRRGLFAFSCWGGITALGPKMSELGHSVSHHVQGSGFRFKVRGLGFRVTGFVARMKNHFVGAGFGTYERISCHMRERIC